MDQQEYWYNMLIRPEWAPPTWIFGPVWSVLYVIIAVTYGIIFYKVLRGDLAKSVALPFMLNLIFNAVFTPLQFVLRNNLLASIDIILVLLTILWMFYVLWYKVPIKMNMRWIVMANIPYLLWVSFATALQLTITFLNL